jgi:hypothetical protein
MTQRRDLFEIYMMYTTFWKVAVLAFQLIGRHCTDISIYICWDVSLKIRSGHILPHAFQLTTH